MKSISNKLIVTFTTLLFFTLLIFSIVSFTISNGAIRALGEGDLLSKLDSEINTMDKYLTAYYGEYTYQDGTFITESGDDIAGDFTAVDSILNDSHAVATIFVKEKDDFLRISTNIKKDGQRAVGTSLGKDSKAYPDVMSGKLYIGKANILGTNYFTAYDPVIIDNEIVGILFIGVEVDQFESDLSNTMGKIRTVYMIMTVIALLIIISITYFIGKALGKPVSEIASSALQISNGDLTIELSEKLRNDKTEIGQLAMAFTTMVESNRSLIQNIQNLALNVVSSSDQLYANSKTTTHSANEVAHTVQEIADGATDQAQNTENGTAETVKLGVDIERNIEYTEEVLKSTEAISSLADEGLELIKDLTSITEKNMTSQNKIYEGIQETNQSAEDISTATELISGIATQTNLLALNAAIEAARAGEAGKGFAVVADEIKKLAEQSQQSTEEIIAVIDKLKSNSETSVKIMDTTNEDIQTQYQAVKQSEEKFNEIYSSLEKFKKEFAMIKESSDMMKDMKDKILDVMQNLSAIAEENAASTEEVSASVTEINQLITEMSTATESLTEMATKLNDETKAFRIE